jgi:hypothetical protein
MKNLFILSLFVGMQIVFAENWPYPLNSCLSCGGPLDESTQATTLVSSGRELKFCCLECVAPFIKDPSAGIASLESQIIASQKESYPLRTCIISGHELGGMGEPVEYVHGNSLVRFCCAACIEPFEKGAVKFLAQIEAARAKP